MYGSQSKIVFPLQRVFFNKQDMKLGIMGLNHKGKTTYDFEDWITNKKTQFHLTRHIKHGKNKEN